MSIKSEWRKIEARWKAWWRELKGQLVADDPADKAVEELSAATAVPSWPAVAKASCWQGKNASIRHMNILSPRIADETVKERLDWAKGRGCNSVHLFVANQGDGEGAGYSIYGTGEPTPGMYDVKSARKMRERIQWARERNLAVAVWLLADDSSRWNKVLLSNPVAYAHDLLASGVLDLADMVVLGLELDEYASDAKVKALASAIREVWAGKIGTHHTGGKAPFAQHGDVVFWQVSPGKSAATVAQSVQSARKSTGKPVVMFELARQPARELCEAALAAGAVGVGNW